MKAQAEGLSIFFKEAREKAGLTQKEVAQTLGYSSPQFISNWERGVCGVPMSALRELIRLYSLKTSEVIDLILESEEKTLKRNLKLKKL